MEDLRIYCPQCADSPGATGTATNCCRCHTLMLADWKDDESYTDRIRHIYDVTALLIDIGKLRAEAANHPDYEPLRKTLASLDAIEAEILKLL